MLWVIKKLFWDWENVFHFKNKYLNFYASAFSFDKKIAFNCGIVDVGLWSFELNLFGLIELKFDVFTPFLAKYNSYQLSLGLLGTSIFMALEDKRNDAILEEHLKQIKETKQCTGQKQLKTK